MIEVDWTRLHRALKACLLVAGTDTDHGTRDRNRLELLGWRVTIATRTEWAFDLEDTF
jgi:hypothetical protein